MPDKIFEGIKLFNNDDFFAAHDVFEDLWMEAESYEKLFFQGLVQISVGNFHLICGNYKGAFSQLSKGIKKLENYQPNYRNIDLKKLIDETGLILNSIKKLIPGNDFDLKLSKIPKINYKVSTQSK